MKEEILFYLFIIFHAIFFKKGHIMCVKKNFSILYKNSKKLKFSYLFFLAGFLFQEQFSWLPFF